MPVWALALLQKIGMWCWESKCWQKVGPALGYTKTIIVIVEEKEEIIPVRELITKESEMKKLVVLFVAVGLLTGCTALKVAIGDKKAAVCKALTDVMDVKNEVATVDYSQISNPKVKEALDKVKVYLEIVKPEHVKAVCS